MNGRLYVFNPGCKANSSSAEIDMRGIPITIAINFNKER
jgi:hypothetical protein